MGTPRPKLKRREWKRRVREVWCETVADLEPGEEATRAARVRDLCPCEHEWDVPLWDIIFAACEDPSPLVRLEALHVIEDSYALGLPIARGMGLICAARKDPAPEVRRFAEEVIRLMPKLRQTRRQRFAPRLKQAVREEEDQD